MADQTKLIEVYHESFKAIVGVSPSVNLVAEAADGRPLFHEACIYHAPSRTVFVTSNQIRSAISRDAATGKTVLLSRVFLGPRTDDVSDASAEVVDVTPEQLASSFLNGGVNFDEDTLLFCAQGSIDERACSGLVLVSASPPHTVTPFLSDFYSIPFNSTNDVIIHPTDQSIWFTDPCYGFHQKIRGAPKLPNQVYRFDPRTGSVRVMADGFARPNGLSFCPDLSVIYITDTGAIHGSDTVAIDESGPSHIYAFDLIQRSNEPFLVNRRVFAFPAGRFPDGIKCDNKGNVYAGCGNGINVWNSGGVLIGGINIEGGVANFCFGEEGEMFLCNESKLWRVQLSKDVRGALLGL